MMARTMFEENFWAENGFDELRRLMKQGSDFVKEAMAVLHERSEIEKQYSTKLQQLAKKARRVNTYCSGSSIGDAWQKFGDSLENECEAHKNLAQDLITDCHNTLKGFIDNHMRLRKPLEQAVEKQKKSHQDRVTEQLKLKRTAHTRCRELEQNLDQQDALIRRNVASDKEISKHDKAVRKADESLVKADREYKDSNVKTEEVRLTWESSMYRCCRHLEELEHIRHEQVTEVFQKYTEVILRLVTPLQESCDELTEAANYISADRDIEAMCQVCGTGPNTPEQILLDTFEEESSNHMNSDRRLSNLDKKIQELEMDIDRKEREKKGVLSLSAAYEQTPDFVDEQGAADVTRQLTEANAMLNMLKANHFKLLSARSDISNLPSPDSPYSEYIQVRKDKQNQTMTLLCVPIEQVSELEERTQGMTAWSPPSPSINHSNSSVKKRSKEQPVYDKPVGAEGGENFDFDQQEPADEYHYISRCEVLYDYEAQQGDELTILPGDTIYVTEKIDDDWWQGNLNGTIGIFPANYVEEVEVY